MRRSLLASPVIALVLLVGCGSEQPNPDPTPAPSPTSGGSLSPSRMPSPEPNGVPLPGGAGGGGGDLVDLRGRGATFVQPIMKIWTEKYPEVRTGKARIDYVGTGSGNGVSTMTNKEVDFGCSDAPMNAKQLEAAKAKGGDVVHVPLVMGAVVPMYNVPGVTKPLAFTGPVLAEIFTGKITAWNDAKLKELNPGVELPDLKIQPVYRDDPSGTTFIFTDYLCKVSGDFKKEIGKPSNEPTWPKGVGTRQPKSDGVAGHILRTAGAIGYIELTYALDTKAQYGSVRNKAGKDLQASLDSITAAAAATLGVKQTEEPYSLNELTFSLTDAGGEASYPIAGMSYALIYKKLPAVKGKTTADFLRWATSKDGQRMARQRNFAPLPEDLQKKIAAALDGIAFE